MTKDDAINDGYSKKVYAVINGEQYFLLVKPKTDLHDDYKAWDINQNKYVKCNGWMSEETYYID